MGYEDATFQNVSFGDAKLALSGALSNPPPAQDAGTPGTPAPGTGQPAASPPATVDPALATPATPGTAQGDATTKPVTEPPKVEDPNKPLPFDQDPKWKKARAAEKALGELLDKHGLLNVEELAERLEKGESLSKILGPRDAKKVLDDADYADRVRKNWDKQKLDKEHEGETPEAKAERLEKENTELRRSHDEYKSDVETKAHAQEVLRNYGTEVDRVISVLETALPEAERGLLNLVLGVDNPANAIDIEDQTAVRKMAREGITKFQATIQKIKQAAIDEYVAGKSKLAVDTTKGAPASVQQGVTRQPIPKDATVDQVFNDTKSEFVEILLKGLEAAH